MACGIMHANASPGEGLVEEKQHIDVDGEQYVHIKLPNKVSYAELDRVLDRLSPAIEAGPEAEDEKLYLDFSSTVFCTPAGITAIAACIENLWQSDRYRAGVVRGPSNRFASMYLRRMDFYAELAIDVEEDFDRHPPFGFRPVTSVADELESPALTRDLVDAIAEKHGAMDASTSSTLKTCLNEIVENVFYHAASPIDALISAQAYPGKKRAELVICDTGCGIKKGLQKIPEYSNALTGDHDAIEMAIEKGVTSISGGITRGTGLWFVSEVVKRNEGKMTILSKDGGVDITANATSRRPPRHWPGTMVVIEFRLDNPISAREIYDDREDWIDYDDYDDFTI